MNDDELLTRMRTALDEVHDTGHGTGLDTAPAGDGTGQVGLTTMSRAHASRRGWLAVAAAAVVLVAGIGAVLVQHGRGQQSISPAASDSEPASSVPVTVPASGTEWYVLDLEGFTPQPERLEVCCPPTPAPGPATVMVWADVNGLDHGVLMLTLTPADATEPELDLNPDVDVVTYDLTPTDATEPELDWSWAMMPDDRASTLISEAVPGSGVPYVLPSQSMRLAGVGLQGMGAMRAQWWSNGIDTVDISVGDYRGQFGHYDTLDVWTPTTVAGHAALRRRDDSGVAYVWQTPSGQWATVNISAGLTDREDEVLGRVRLHEGEPTPALTTVPTSAPTPDPDPPVQPDTVLIGAASVIDSGNGPMLANVLLSSLPPQGGDIPLDGFDWSMIDDEQTLNGVTWTETWYIFIGTWDGTTFHLTAMPTPIEPGGPTDTPDYTLTPGCTEASLMPLLDELVALDSTALHISTTAGIQTGGRCDAEMTAWFDTAELRAALAPFGDKVRVEFLFHRAEG
ncbi:MAG: hypothetical protein ACKPDI_04345 [Actinomycetota bacterium]